jgi:hypothetical protein
VEEGLCENGNFGSVLLGSQLVLSEQVLAIARNFPEIDCLPLL